MTQRHFKKAQVWEAFKDFNLWTISFSILATSIPYVVFSSIFTPVINGFGFNAFQALLFPLLIGLSVMVSVIFMSLIMLKAILV